MSRTISSSFTAFYKFVFSTLWIGGFAAGTVAMFIVDSSGKWSFLGGLIFGGSLIGWMCVPLKRVEIDGAELVVSNYFRTMRVPLLEIREVTECWLISTHPVWIDFHSRTEFGSRIMFMPQARMFAVFWPHPIVGELRRLAAGEGCEQGPPPLPRSGGEE